MTPSAPATLPDLHTVSTVQEYFGATDRVIENGRPSVIHCLKSGAGLTCECWEIWQGSRYLRTASSEIGLGVILTDINWEVPVE